MKVIDQIQPVTLHLNNALAELGKIQLAPEKMGSVTMAQQRILDAVHWLTRAKLDEKSF